jgi:hypothetical protein
MTPSPSATSAPLPPLPDMPGKPGGSAPDAPGGYLASMLSGIAPVISAVDQIAAACKTIVQSGSIPGSEQFCAQIMAIASQLKPMAVQQAMGGPGGGMSPMMPPPGAGAPPPQGAQ